MWKLSFQKVKHLKKQQKNSVAVGTIKREQEVEKDGREKETNQTV